MRSTCLFAPVWKSVCSLRGRIDRVVSEDTCHRNRVTRALHGQSRCPTGGPEGRHRCAFVGDGSVKAPPDELVADMVAQATFPSAAAVQRHVNALIEGGMKGENANLWGSLRFCCYCPVVVRETEAEIAAHGRPLRAYRSAPIRNEPHRFARSLQIHPAAFDRKRDFRCTTWRELPPGP
jgi:hypothetical protein